MISRRTGLRALGATAAAAAATLAAPRLARAAWPADRPIEVIVPYPPGGGVDTMARCVAGGATASGWRALHRGQPGGAGGQLGWEAAQAAAADGYTLAATSVPALVTYPIERATRYRPTPSPTSPMWWTTRAGCRGGQLAHGRLADLLAAARAQPGEVTYGTTGVGSDDHLLVIALEEAAGLKPMNHAPFNGQAPLATALIGGHLQVGAFNMSEGLAHLRDGRIRALGQAGASRWAATPDAPTFREQGLDVTSGATRGMVAPPISLPRYGSGWKRRSARRSPTPASCGSGAARPAAVATDRR